MTVFNMATNAELLAALASAIGGDEIVGAAGADLGNLGANSKSFLSYVRITSADPGNKCSFSTMNLSNCSYIDIDGVALNYTFQTGDASSYRPFQITSSDHIKLRNCVNTGGMGASGYGTGEGIFWQNVDDFAEEDNYTTGYRKSSNQ